MTSSRMDAASAQEGREHSGAVTASGMRCVLVVEPDAKLADRIVEAIWAFGGLEPIHVENRERADAALALHRVDCMVVTPALPDGNGFQFLAQLRRTGAYRDLPFVFLADDARVKTKVAAFRLGAHDYVVKPVAVGELCARIAAAIHRVEDARAAAVDRGFSLAGDFAGMSFSELVGLLHTGRRSGRLSIETPQARGQLLLVEGQIYHASFGDRWGEDAFYAVLFESDGRFEFLPEHLDRNRIPNTVALSPTALLVEGARRLDEAIRNGTVPAAVRPKRMWIGPPPDAELAAGIAADLEGAAGQAEVVLRDLPELAEWSRGPADTPRVVAAVVGDARRFPGWLTAAGACTFEGLFADALSHGQRVPCLSWEFTGGRCFDVVLLDHRAPGAMIEGLCRELSFFVVVPPLGRWKELGIRARAELSSLLSRLRPQALFGVGVVGLQGKLAELLEQVDVAARCEMLGDTGELTDWLREGLCRWGGAG